MQTRKQASGLVVYAALAANLAIAMMKFVGSWWTGSSAMLSEAIHSTVDTGNQGLLLFGLRRAARPPSAKHPFGHSRELYFWSFVVALLIFALGGAFSIYEGFRKIADPEPVSQVWVVFAVLPSVGSTTVMVYAPTGAQEPSGHLPSQVMLKMPP